MVLGVGSMVYGFCLGLIMEYDIRKGLEKIQKTQKTWWVLDRKRKKEKGKENL